jgi:hypothetical protein
VPGLPTFRTEGEAVALLERFIANQTELVRVQQDCAARLADATYAQRLRKVMDISFERRTEPEAVANSNALGRERAVPLAPPSQPASVSKMIPIDRVVPFDDDWDDVGGVVRRSTGGNIVIDAGAHSGPGAERGLASRVSYEAVDLNFEARLESGAHLLAKVHQTDRVDQTTNSYHLHIDSHRAYLARHCHVFRQFEAPRAGWTRFRLACSNGELSLWRNDRLLHRVRDRALTGGFAFVGAQGGTVRLRQLRISNAESARRRTLANDNVQELLSVTAPTPRLSIITTVYDRTECLKRCIASVQRLTFEDFEHVIVADHPAPEVMEHIQQIVRSAGDPRIGLYNLGQRFNNWGIAPAAAGLRRARGEYLAFLSDDNGYIPDHFEPLVRLLDRDAALGFVYSSCRYDGRLVLNHPIPRPGRIDLGQPLFRRELFDLHFDTDLPFDMMAWDWQLIDALMRRGVRWRHVDRQSFLFRLEKYPQS